MKNYWAEAQQGATTPKEKIAALIAAAERIVIGAGAGLSTAAGFTYSGERFQRYFTDFARRFGIHDMYSGGFYPYPDHETYWGWWCRHIWVNRYIPLPSDLYARLLRAVEGRDFFVLTTNVDHAFQRAGFPKKHLFYTQGDYGLFQSSDPHGPATERTYDNETIVRAMLQSEGWTFTQDGDLAVPEAWGGAAGVRTPSMRIAGELVPYCPDDGEMMTTNLRADDTFVEDAGWHESAGRYQAFLQEAATKRTLFLELGVGQNTPGIIKYPFWNLTKELPQTCYVSVNPAEHLVPPAIEDRAYAFACDIADVF